MTEPKKPERVELTIIKERSIHDMIQETFLERLFKPDALASLQAAMAEQFHREHLHDLQKMLADLPKGAVIGSTHDAVMVEVPMSEYEATQQVLAKMKDMAVASSKPLWTAHQEPIRSTVGPVDYTERFVPPRAPNFQNIPKTRPVTLDVSLLSAHCQRWGVELTQEFLEEGTGEQVWRIADPEAAWIIGWLISQMMRRSPILVAQDKAIAQAVPFLDKIFAASGCIPVLHALHRGTRLTLETAMKIAADFQP